MNSNKPMVSAQLDCKGDLRALKACARKNKITVSEVIRRAVVEYINKAA